MHRTTAGSNDLPRTSAETLNFKPFALSSFRDFVIPSCLALIASVSLVAATAPAAAAERPNVILLMADDQGWGDTAYNGHPYLKTPNLDAMAAAGLRFNRFYAGAPVCSPTRGSALTGRHPFRYGIFSANVGHMLREEITLAEKLREIGYTTGHFGKWHLGTLNASYSSKPNRKPELHYAPPDQHGFDEWFATEYAVPTWDPASGNYSQTNPYYHNGKLASDNLEGDDSRVIMDRAIPFIRKAVSGDKPFFAVVWFHASHAPVVSGPAYLAMYADRSEGEQHFYGCLTALDEQVGRLRAELRDLGVADDTLVWYCADNGPEGEAPSGRNQGTAGLLRGRKRSLFEGGVRVPGIVEWPSQIKPGTVTDVAASTLDYFPTVMEIVGQPMPSDRPYDGLSLVPLIEGRWTERPRPILFETVGGAGSSSSRGSPRMAMIENRYKLLTDMQPEGDLLFDLVADPSEQHNLAADKPQEVERMRAALAEWRDSCVASHAGRDYGDAAFRPIDAFPGEQQVPKRKSKEKEKAPARKRKAAGNK